MNCTDGFNSAVSETRTITINAFRGDKTFTSTQDGSTRTYWLDLPDNFDNSTPTPVVIFLHGYGGSRLSYPQKYPSLRQTFQNNTWIVASVDCRTVNGYQDWYAEPSRRDIADVLNTIRSDYKIDSNHMHIMGNSMGGGGALKYAMFNNQLIASLVDIHGITNFTQFYYETSTYRASLVAAYGGTPLQVPTVYANESALGNEQRFSHTPVMILHGTADDVVSVSQSRCLNQSLNALGYTVKYIEVPGVTHDASVLISSRELEIFNWLKDHRLVANCSLHQTHLVVRGAHDEIFYRMYNSTTGSWTSWNLLPGATADGPAAVATGNQLHIVVRGVNYDQIWYGYVNLTTRTFCGWTPLNGATPSAPTLVANDTTLCLVVRGENNIIYYRFCNIASKTWSNWTAVPGGTTIDSPAAILLKDTLHMVARGVNCDQVWHGYVNLTDNTFSGWTLLSGATPSAPTLTTNSTSLCLVVRGETDLIWYRFYNVASRVWSDWTSLPSGATIDGPAATFTNNQVQIVVRGENYNQIWHCYVNLIDDTLSQWTLVSGSTRNKPTLTS
jgi:pimeloyl-ACP methyl ester carboxylesterase